MVAPYLYSLLESSDSDEHIHQSMMANQEDTYPSVVQQAIDPQSTRAQRIYAIPLAIWTAPYRRAFNLYTWQPLQEIRAANGNRETLIPLVKKWKEDKYAELGSVQVAASFCGGVTFSTLSWSRRDNAIWVTDALTYSSLICAISAIITSIQTKSILDDLPTSDQLDDPTSLSNTDVQRMRRAILRYKKKPGIKHWVMLFIWQYPSMTAAYAWCCYLCGLTLYICNPFIRGIDFNDAHRITVVYLVVASICLVAYISATLFVYSGERDLLHSVTSSRNSTLASPRSNRVEVDVTQSTQSLSVIDFAYGARKAGGNHCRLLYS